MIYPGYIIDTIRKAITRNVPMAISNHQANGCYGIHQCKVKVKDDPTVYRLIVAPADAPITINGRPIGDHFAQPLGDA